MPPVSVTSQRSPSGVHLMLTACEVSGESQGPGDRVSGVVERTAPPKVRDRYLGWNEEARERTCADSEPLSIVDKQP